MVDNRLLLLLLLQVAGSLGGIFGLMNLFTRACGGIGSDWCARNWGMRGRLWILYVVLAASGLFCLLMGLSSHSLSATITMMVVFSVFVQAACGCTFGVCPFVSNRSMGLLTGLVAAGGNAFSGGCCQVLVGPYNGGWAMSSVACCFTCSGLQQHGLLVPRPHVWVRMFTGQCFSCCHHLLPGLISTVGCGLLQPAPGLIVLPVLPKFSPASCTPGICTSDISCGSTAGITHSLFFAHVELETHQGFIWMGVMMLAALQLLPLLRFPAWGGMLSGPSHGVSEESYYVAEYTVAERAEGVHLSALKFAHESRSQTCPAGRGSVNCTNDEPGAGGDRCCGLWWGQGQASKQRAHTAEQHGGTGKGLGGWCCRRGPDKEAGGVEMAAVERKA